jgi:hypothetical protein
MGKQAPGTVARAGRAAAIAGRSLAVGAILALSLLLPALVMAQSGRSGASVAVQPDPAQAGSTVTITGRGLDPNSVPDLVLAGDGLHLELGNVQVDSSGAFRRSLTLASHLPAGDYRVEAVGASTLVAALHVVPAATNGQPAADAVGAAAAGSRSALSSAAFVIVTGVVVVAALMVARKGERLSRALEEAKH